MHESWIRSTAFLRKELAEIIRQPQLVLTLIVGPFLILLLFGAGLGDLATTVRTMFLVDEGNPFAQLVEGFSNPAGSRLRVDGVTSDREAALQRLRGGDLDLVVEIPADAEQRFAADEQATVVLHHNYVDPLETNALILTVGRTVGAINDQVLRGLVAEGQVDAERAAGRVARAQQTARLLRIAVERGDEVTAGERRAELARVLAQADDDLSAAAIAPLRVRGLVEAGGDPAEPPSTTLDAVQDRVNELAPTDEGALTEIRELESDLARISVALDRFRQLSPETIVNPFAGRAVRVGEGTIGLSDFYAPAMVVLLLQHMVVTVVSLSVVRDEQLGTQELFRVAPLSALELLVGKYLAGMVIGGLMAVAVISLLVVGLGVPVIGSWGWLLACVTVLIAASCGLGMLLALAARSDTQAVQYAMMLLLASIFLCGFVLTLDYFLPPIQVLARFLPATLGIELIRGLMLLGAPPSPTLFAALTGMALGLFTLNAWLLTSRTRAR